MLLFLQITSYRVIKRVILGDVMNTVLFFLTVFHPLITYKHIILVKAHFWRGWVVGGRGWWGHVPPTKLPLLFNFHSLERSDTSSISSTETLKNRDVIFREKCSCYSIRLGDAEADRPKCLTQRFLTRFSGCSACLMKTKW